MAPEGQGWWGGVAGTSLGWRASQVTPAQLDPTSSILLSLCQPAEVSENSLRFRVTTPHGSLLPRGCESDCIPSRALLRLTEALISSESAKPGLLLPTVVRAWRGCTWHPRGRSRIHLPNCLFI